METRGGNEISLDVLARLITLSAFLFIIITVISIGIVRILLKPGMCALMSYKNEGATLKCYSFLLSHFCFVLYVDGRSSSKAYEDTLIITDQSCRYLLKQDLEMSSFL